MGRMYGAMRPTRPWASWIVATPKAASASTAPRSARSEFLTTIDIVTPVVGARHSPPARLSPANWKSAIAIRKRYRSTLAAMHTNLRHLHTFREVARLGSVSAAARSVHISQPAVTQAIAGLERYFGSPLLLRRSTGVSLTAAGEICLARVERSMNQIRDAVHAITRNVG